VELDQPDATLAELERLLSRDERERASRFRFLRDRNRFVASRGALRIALGNYLAKPAEAVAIGIAPKGKPRLAESEESDLQFNISHSRNVALFGFAPGRDLGVDVEFINPEFPCASVAPTFCCERELGELCALPANAMRACFFKIWTAKEARLKASGEGFFCEAKALDVRFEKNGAISIKPRTDPPWLMREIEIGESFAAAMAVSGSRVLLNFFEFPFSPPFEQSRSS
jgi:4'-phosphopantetheinyl transferase